MPKHVDLLLRHLLRLDCAYINDMTDGRSTQEYDFVGELA